MTTSTRTGASSCLLRCTRRGPRARRSRGLPGLSPAYRTSPGASAPSTAGAACHATSAAGATTRTAAGATTGLVRERVTLVDVGVEPVGRGGVARAQPRADVGAGVLITVVDRVGLGEPLAGSAELVAADAVIEPRLLVERGVVAARVGLVPDPATDILAVRRLV